MGSSQDFKRNTVVLSLGTTISQVLLLCFYPLLARLYSPAEFGSFAVFTMLVSLLSIVATGSYENAIVIAKTKRMAANIASLVAVRGLLVLLSVTTLIIVFADSLASIFGDPTLTKWIVFVPLTCAANIVLLSLTEWCVREKFFTGLSKYRIYNSLSTSINKCIFGIVLVPFPGLILGEFLGKAISGSFFFRSAASRDTKLSSSITLKRISLARKRFSRFPKYMMPDQIINTLGGSVHIIFIGSAFGASQLGYVSFVFAALYLPINVVSSAIRDVFRQRISVDYVETGNVRPQFLKLLIYVSLLALSGFAVLYLIAPAFFIILLGEQWAPTGDYVRILIPMFFFSFVSMSVGVTLVISQRTRVSLIWQVFNLAFTVLALYFGSRTLGSIIATLALYSAIKSLFYFVYICLSYYYCRDSRFASKPSLGRVN